MRDGHIVLTTRSERRRSGFGRIARAVTESADVPVHELDPRSAISIGSAPSLTS